MTGNTTPYGEVLASSYFSSGSTSYPAWRAFAADASLFWNATTSTADDWIEYDFVSPVVIKEMVGELCITEIGSTAHNKSATIACQLYNGTDWIDCAASASITNNTATDNYQKFMFTFTVIGSYTKFRLKMYNKQASVNTRFGAKTVQFYGLDYSEKEFEEGSTKKWLYDHGVELVDIYTAKTGSAVVTKEENAIYMKTVNGQMAVCSNNEAIDLTGYNLVRAKNEPMVTTYATPVYAQIFIHPNKATSTSDYSSNYVAVSNFTNEIINTFGLDISAINTAEYIQYGFYGGNSYTENRFKELWLE
jgi:hypothetical protein